jgi:hypothetical protein
LNSKHEKYDISELLIILLESDLTDSQRNCLVEWSRDDPDAAETYHDFLSTYSIICNEVSGHVEGQYGLSEDTQFDQAIWTALAECEKTAPSVEIPVKESDPELITNVVYPPRQKRKLSKFSLFTLAAPVAAMLCMFLFVQFAPVPGQEIATLQDAIDAKFIDAPSALEIGSRLSTNEGEWFLQKGIAKILYDNGVEVVLEGPVEFELTSLMDMGLTYGRAYTRVPETGTGFTIVTDNSRIIDLGTEFGVYVSQGNTEVHVLKGRTTLVAGSQDRARQVVDISKGQARMIRDGDSHIQEIEIKKDYFVRQIDSKRNAIWKGSSLNLAYLAAGGDGFKDSGDNNRAINPASGQVGIPTEDSLQLGQGHYSPVPQRQFVDGVFVPNAASGATIVSSAGHTFDGLPSTNNYYFTVISSPAKRYPKGFKEGFRVSLNTNDEEETSLSMHANAGITFDLNKIRQSLPGLEITGFKADCGLARFVVDENFIEGCEFWVLVDGQPVFHHKVRDKQSAVQNIDISIKLEHRFLTLVVTDGGNTNDGDWCLFANPSLSLELKN